MVDLDQPSHASVRRLRAALMFQSLRARWRAAMRGKAVSDQLFELIAEAPADTDRAILIYPSGPGERQTAIRWYGMNAEQVAMTLYDIADEVLRQRVPLRK